MGYAQSAAPEGQGLRVFLDCGNDCDFDYLRREVTFVNYVRARQIAQVHVLVTQRDSGAGEEWTLSFIGLEDFTGRETTLDYNSSVCGVVAAASDAHVRNGPDTKHVRRGDVV